MPPVPTSTDLKGDFGVKFIDLNGDGKEDIIKSYWYILNGVAKMDKETFLNSSKMLYQPSTSLIMRSPYFNLNNTAMVENKDSSNILQKNNSGDNLEINCYPNPFSEVLNISSSYNSKIPFNAEIYLSD